MSIIDRIAIRSQILSCTNCPLSSEVTPVPFSGPSPNPFVVIGEAPGATENKRGEPFVGPAGQLLRRAINFSMTKVTSSWWTDDSDEVARIHEGYSDTFSYLNVVSCYPDGTPTRAHIKACAENLWGQLEVIQPSYGLLVGGVALSALVPSIQGGKRPDGSTVQPTSLSSLRGSWVVVKGSWGKVRLMVTWHPSAVLREGGLKTGKGIELSADIDQFARVVAKWVEVEGMEIGQPGVQMRL